MKLKEQKDLEEIKDFMLSQTVMKKEMLDLKEAASYLGLSKSKLYKLTSTKQIPFYRISQKLIRFKRTEIDIWMETNKIEAIHVSVQIPLPKGGI